MGGLVGAPLHFIARPPPTFGTASKSWPPPAFLSRRLLRTAVYTRHVYMLPYSACGCAMPAYCHAHPQISRTPDSHAAAKVLQARHVACMPSMRPCIGRCTRAVRKVRQRVAAGGAQEDMVIEAGRVQRPQFGGTLIIILSWSRIAHVACGSGNSLQARHDVVSHRPSWVRALQI